MPQKDLTDRQMKPSLLRNETNLYIRPDKRVLEFTLYEVYATCNDQDYLPKLE